MKILRSYVCGRWHTADRGLALLVDPSTEEVIAQASSAGVDFAAALANARERGGPALRAMTFAQRGELLKAMSKALREHRDELLDLSRRNNGTTTSDGSFDIDGATGTLSYYAAVSKALGSRQRLAREEGAQLARTEAFWGRHLWLPRPGVAVHVNAFNFPAWGFAEKAACALLAGMPVITKPATATALVAERCVEIIIDAGILPAGTLQLICGSTGDLLDRLGPYDVFAFTGSAATADGLRSKDALRQSGARINVEADSLNAAVLAPDVAVGSPAWNLFIDDVVREMIQKTGQKCTAVRRILAPSTGIDKVEGALADRLSAIITGDPSDDQVDMGPLATRDQLDDAERGVAELEQTVRKVVGDGRRIDGRGAAAGKGYFFPPTLLRASKVRPHDAVSSREVFAPVATLIPYSGAATDAAEIVGFGGGTLVTSAYTDDQSWLSDFVAFGAHSTGRLYLGTSSAAEAAPGSGVAMPQCLHGGPGRAGGGEELGGLVGVQLYLQRVALQGHRQVVDQLADEEG